jgi:uncharacterized SAM-binding protein YcdF (DUF218 family)
MVSTIVLFLTKLLPVFVYPLGLALALFLLGVLLGCFGRRTWAFGLIATVAGGLWVVSTPVFGEWALGDLERQNPPVAIADLPTADVAIVLGGTLGGPTAPRVTIDLTAASDRILHAARLFRAGKVRRILVTGGNLPWLTGRRSEAELISELLIEWGVPSAAIESAGGSRNTYENALEIREMFLKQRFDSALLVTSAAHMPRALAVFQHAGIPVHPATTDIEVVVPGPWTPLRWLPDVSALQMTTAALRERIGMLAYRGRGYL